MTFQHVGVVAVIALVGALFVPSAVKDELHQRGLMDGEFMVREADQDGAQLRKATLEPIQADIAQGTQRVERAKAALKKTQATHAAADAKAKSAALRAQATERDLANAIRAQKEAAQAQAAREKAFKASRAGRLSDSAYTDPRDALDRVIANAASAELGFNQYSRVHAGKRGYVLEVYVTPKRKKSYRNRGIEADFKALLLTIDPAWVEQVVVRGKTLEPVKFGPLSTAVPELVGFLQTYFGATGGALPPPRKAGPRKGTTPPEWKVKNGTNKRIEIRYYGSKRGTLSVPANAERSVTLPEGTYYVAVSVPGDTSVRPFSGSYTFEKGYVYQNSYVIKTTFLPGKR